MMLQNQSINHFKTQIKRHLKTEYIFFFFFLEINEQPESPTAGV